MKWDRLFLLGLILSFSPFFVKYKDFVFHYSLLGYGLTLLSFYYKENLNRIDVLGIAALLIVMGCGILNLFNWFYFFSFVFSIIVILIIFYMAGGWLMSIFAHFVVFMAGVILPFWYFNINNYLFLKKVVNINYGLNFVIVLILAYLNIKKLPKLLNRKVNR